MLLASPKLVARLSALSLSPSCLTITYPTPSPTSRVRRYAPARPPTLMALADQDESVRIAVRALGDMRNSTQHGSSCAYEYIWILTPKLCS